VASWGHDPPGRPGGKPSPGADLAAKIGRGRGWVGDARPEGGETDGRTGRERARGSSARPPRTEARGGTRRVETSSGPIGGSNEAAGGTRSQPDPGRRRVRVGPPAVRPGAASRL